MNPTPSDKAAPGGATSSILGIKSNNALNLLI